jgi:hypothetical protein
MELLSIGKFAKQVGVTHVTANRLYGQRSKKTKRLIDEVKNNAYCVENKAETDK